MKLEYKNRQELALREAKRHYEIGFALNPLSGLSYYSASTIMEYEGVEITNLAQVERYLGLLLTAQALEPHHKEIEEVLKTVLDFLKRKWNEQGNFVGLDQLATWLNRDHLKILFQTKPELFALANQPAHAPFFKQHPELQNKEAFTKKYPDVATILPEEMTLEGIRQAIARNPFGAQLSLMTDNTAEKELLSNTLGLVVQCWNNQRPLAVYLRHEEDAKTMTEYAKTTPPPKGALFNLSTVRMDGYAQPVYVLSLKPAPT